MSHFFRVRNHAGNFLCHLDYCFAIGDVGGFGTLVVTETAVAVGGVLYLAHARYAAHVAAALRLFCPADGGNPFAGYRSSTLGLYA